MINYATIDNTISSSKLSIGGSSNLAQLALTYGYNFNNEKYCNYACILSVIAQISIDSAKRLFDIDVEEEIKRIKDDLNILENGYPEFWKYIKEDFREFNKDGKSKINYNLKCPMNYVCNLKISEFKPETSTLPIEYFFKSFELGLPKRKSKKIEELIEKYSFDLYLSNKDNENYILNQIDLEELIKDVEKINLSNKYLGLFSWLINRAFVITSGVKRKRNELSNNTYKNKSILLKTLYDINKECLLKCFSNNC